MTRYITALIAIFMLSLLPSHALGDKTKKKKLNVEVRPELPMPDARVPVVKPQAPHASVSEPGVLNMQASEVVYGEHTESQRGGIDVSHYQGQIDWNAVAHDGRALYAFCKATESTSLMDNTYQYNVREARRNGVPVGAYHFFSPKTSGAEQLKFFMDNVDVSQLDVVPMLDIEVRGKASLEEFHNQIRVWLKGFEKKYHFKPIIYASVNFYNKYLAGAFDDYMYMIAKYGEGCPSPQGPIPFVMWQYTANGRINGIKGAVDMSYFVDSFDLKDILIKNHR